MPDDLLMTVKAKLDSSAGLLNRWTSEEVEALLDRCTEAEAGRAYWRLHSEAMLARAQQAEAEVDRRQAPQGTARLWAVKYVKEKARAEQAEAENARYAAHLDGLSDRVDALTIERHQSTLTYQHALAEKDAEVERLRERAENAEAELSGKRDTLTIAGGNYDVLLAHANEVARENAALRDELVLSRNNEAAVSSEVTDQRAVLLYAQNARRAAEADLTALRAENEQQHAELVGLREQVSRGQDAVNTLNNRLTALGERHAAAATLLEAATPVVSRYHATNCYDLGYLLLAVHPNRWSDWQTAARKGMTP